MSQQPYGLIYKITNLQNNKVYIGQTTNFKNYFCSGRSINKEIKLIGKQFFKREILGYCYSNEELDECEIECIYFFRSFGSDGEHEDNVYGYNRTRGGKSWNTKGCKHSKETKQKMSNVRKGKSKTKEHRINIGNGNKGKVVSNETKNKLRNLNVGKTLSYEHKNKIGNSVRGKTKGIKKGPQTEEHKEKNRMSQLNAPRLTCTFCNKLVDRGNAKQWHFDNCKNKK